MRRQSVVVTLLAIASVLSLVAVLNSFGIPDLLPTLLVGMTYFAVGIVPLRLPRGDVLHIGVGIIVAAVLLVGIPEACFGVALGALAVFLVGFREIPTQHALLDVVRQPLLVVMVAILQPAIVDSPVVFPISPTELVMASLLAVIAVGLDVGLHSIAEALIEQSSVLESFLGMVRIVGGVYLGQASVGVVLAIVYPSMGIASGIVLVILMMVMKHRFGL